jgi:PAS domain-containing protein
MLLVIGAGLIFLSFRWLLLVLISTVAGWCLVAVAVPPSPGWVHFGFALFSSVALSIMLHIMRVRSLAGLQALRLKDEEHKRMLEAALARSEQEVAMRKKIEGQIREMNELLEARVRERSEQLYESNMRLSALVEASPLPIAILTAEGIVQMWNPAAERVFGWTELSARGRGVHADGDGGREEGRGSGRAERLDGASP